jgi:hypothetical protein
MVAAYKLTDIDTNEVYEGTANYLATQLRMSPSTIQKGYKDGRIIYNKYKVELSDKPVKRAKKVASDGVLAEWDEFTGAVRATYGKKKEV